VTAEHISDVLTVVGHVRLFDLDGEATISVRLHEEASTGVSSRREITKDINCESDIVVGET
jgi:hypothetical protein